MVGMVGIAILASGISRAIPGQKIAIPIMTDIDDDDIFGESWGGPQGRPQSHSNLGPLMKEIFIVLAKTLHERPAGHARLGPLMKETFIV